MLSIGLVLVPLALGVFFTGQNSLGLINDALNESNKNALVSIREQKKQQINNYITFIKGQIKTYASSDLVIAATDELLFSYSDYLSEANFTDDGLKQYYKDSFGQQFNKLNSDSVNLDNFIPEKNTTAYSLQTSYLANNPNPIGEKGKLKYAKDASTYGKVHETYHPSFRNYLKEFGYFDIYIVDFEQGDILYSVEKKVDFATNLAEGPYSNSALGLAYKNAKSSPKGTVSFTRFSPYIPEYNKPTAFISSPIYDGDSPLGVLIFQIPVNRISTIMTNSGEWEKVGLGQTGETYIVGSDSTLRSESRLFVENKNEYLQTMTRLNQTESASKAILLETTVGIQQAHSQAVELALNGETGFIEFNNELGDKILSAYTYIESAGERWALIANINKKEAFATYEELKDSLIWTSLITVVVFLLLGSGLGQIVAGRISKHISRLSEAMDDISKGDGDLTSHIDYDGNNEFGDISTSFNEIIKNFHDLIADIKQTSLKILQESDQVHNVALDSQIIVQAQADSTRSTVAALEQFEASINEVARISNDSQKISRAVVEDSENSSQRATRAVSNIEQLMQTVEHSSEVIHKLNNEVSDITSVLDVINSIADQTNLLALNAAIEAARAGEHGRGFAVVAEEVRSLAMRTQDSTVQIQHKLENLDGITKQAVSTMESAKEDANKGVERVTSVKSTLDELTRRIEEMEQLIVSVASATEQQSKTIGEINNNMLMIDSQSQEVEAKARENEQASLNLNEVANHINNQVSKFKLND
jgi:methyl-accepting chemotaxis protein